MFHQNVLRSHPLYPRLFSFIFMILFTLIFWLVHVEPTVLAKTSYDPVSHISKTALIVGSYSPSATPIDFDVTQSGTIGSVGATVEYTFPGVSGDKLLIRIAVPSGALDPKFEVHRPDTGYECGTFTTGPFLELECVLDATGTFTITISDHGNDDTGDFDLYIQRINGIVDATPVTYDVVQTGTISSDLDTEAFTFTGTIGDKLLIRLEVTSGTLDPNIRVYRPDIGYECGHFTTGTFDEIECVLGATGVFTILVSDWNVGSGDFDLYIQRINNIVDAIPITYDEVQAGTISPDLDTDAFTFTGTIGDKLLIRLEVTSGTLDPNIRVYRPDIGYECGHFTTGTFDEIECVLGATGVFTILVSDWNVGSGDFDLYIQRINNAVDATPITYDEVQAGTISPDLDTDAFTFTGTTGDKLLIRLEVTSGTLDPNIRVYRPDIGYECGHFTTGTFLEFECILDATGGFTIIISDRYVGSGDYDLYVQGINNPANVIVGGYGFTHADNISNGAEMDAYTFEGTIDDTALITMTATSGTLDPQFRVYRPDGTLLCSDSSSGTSASEACVLDMNGTHVVFVHDWGGTDIGEYIFEIACVTCPNTVNLSIKQEIDMNPNAADLAYLITITNNGPMDATGVIFNNILPLNVAFLSATPSQGNCPLPVGNIVTCDLGSLTNGADASISIDVNFSEAGLSSNTVSTTSNQIDSNIGNNFDVVHAFSFFIVPGVE